jgi:hypothetical protein
MNLYVKTLLGCAGLQLAMTAFQQRTGQTEDAILSGLMVLAWLLAAQIADR